MLMLTVKRKAVGWSQNRLAQEARITPSDLSKIESQRMRPYPPQLEKLAIALGLTQADADLLMEEVDSSVGYIG